MSTTSESNLFTDIDAEVFPTANIGTLTYYAIGGSADSLVKPNSVEALSLLMQRCMNENIQVRILGKGANLLVDDDGVEGIVLKLDHPCFHAHTLNNPSDIHHVECMGGADLSKILMESAREGLSGLQPLAGIPASIGGAIRMNAGGKYGAVSDSLISILAMSDSGEVRCYEKKDVVFGYRTCKILEPIILSATFQLTPDRPNNVRDEIKDIFAWKKKRQPLAETSAGCAFKNYCDEDGQYISAGLLIDETGLKGLAVGGAKVSEQHANFITTNPACTAKDVLKLMVEVQKRVFDVTGITLEREVVVWSKDVELNDV